jgi:hypothetical protein
LYNGSVAVTFNDADAAGRAQAVLNGRWFDGSQLDVLLLRPQPPPIENNQTEFDAAADAFLNSLLDETLATAGAESTSEITSDGAVIQRGPVLRIINKQAAPAPAPGGPSASEAVRASFSPAMQPTPAPSLELISKIEEETDDFLNSLL